MTYFTMHYSDKLIKLYKKIILNSHFNQNDIIEINVNMFIVCRMISFPWLNSAYVSI